jgi:hypothetical protein
VEVLVEDNILSVEIRDNLGSGFSFLLPTLKKFKLGGKMDVPKYKKKVCYFNKCLN